MYNCYVIHYDIMIMIAIIFGLWRLRRSVPFITKPNYFPLQHKKLPEGDTSGMVKSDEGELGNARHGH